MLCEDAYVFLLTRLRGGAPTTGFKVQARIICEAFADPDLTGRGVDKVDTKTKVGWPSAAANVVREVGAAREQGCCSAGELGGRAHVHCGDAGGLSEEDEGDGGSELGEHFGDEIRDF